MFERNICKTDEEKNIAMADILPGEGSCMYKKPINTKDVYLGIKPKTKP